MAMGWSLITLLLLGSGLFHGIGAVDAENVPSAQVVDAENVPSAQVVGTVLCAPCFNRGFSRTSHFISGASVLLECTDLGFRKEVTTDEHGKFEVHLPPSTSQNAVTTAGCTVKLIKSNNPGCDVVSSRGSLRLKLNTQRPQVLSAGVLAFTPQEQPSTCARKVIRRGAIESSSKKVSINSESARRASETSGYPPPAVTPWWSIPEPAPAPVTSPPVLGSTTLPPLPSTFFPLPPLPPIPPRLPLPPLPPFLFPPTPAATTPSQPPDYFPFPPFPQPPIPSLPFPLPPLPQPPIPSLLFPLPPLPQPPIPSLPFPLPPLPPQPPTLPFPLPPLPGFTPPPPTPRP